MRKVYHIQCSINMDDTVRRLILDEIIAKEQECPEPFHRQRVLTDITSSKRKDNTKHLFYAEKTFWDIERSDSNIPDTVIITVELESNVLDIIYESTDMGFQGTKTSVVLGQLLHYIPTTIKVLGEIAGVKDVYNVWAPIEIKEPITLNQFIRKNLGEDSLKDMKVLRLA